MYKMELDRLDDIIDKNIDSIKTSVDEINDIRDITRRESMELEEEFLKLQIEAIDLINRVERLETHYKLSGNKLLMVNMNDDDTTEEQMKDIYEETDHLSLELAAEKEREMTLSRRRNQLVLQLKHNRIILEKINKISKSIDINFNVLSGDSEKITHKMDGSQMKEIWGFKVIQAQELERKRIARDMHDGPAQSLASLVLKTELCIKLIDKDMDRAKLELQNLKDHIRSTIDETRHMIYNLRPMGIDEFDLISTLKRLVNQHIDKNGQQIEFLVKESTAYNACSIDPLISLTLYRITQESLNNIIKYAEASSVRIELTYEPETIDLLISDNGIGFVVEEQKSNLQDNRGFGLSMMCERANLLNGEIHIISEINKGTSIHTRVPLIDKEESNE